MWEIQGVGATSGNLVSPSILSSWQCTSHCWDIPEPVHLPLTKKPLVVLDTLGYSSFSSSLSQPWRPSSCWVAWISLFALETPSYCSFLHVFWLFFYFLFFSIKNIHWVRSLPYRRVLSWFRRSLFKAVITICYTRVVHKEPVRIRAPLSLALEKISKGLLLPWSHHSLNR